MVKVPLSSIVFLCMKVGLPLTWLAAGFSLLFVVLLRKVLSTLALRVASR
ncbi:MAG: hypothetical protein R3E12_11585 [Candidatus Eisenbacteria bacterium]